MNRKIIISIAVLAVFLVAGSALGYWLGYDHGFENRTVANINSFDECAAAGYPIMESYPEQCRTPDGRNFVNTPDGNENGEGVFCTMDAKLCADGSYVGRVPPACEFAACPASASGSGTVEGKVLLGPTCPVERDPPDPKCADRPYAVSLVLTSPDGARVIREFRSNANGEFAISVPAGTYAIRSAVAANILPYCAAESFTVRKGATAQVAVSCDTGIR